MDSSSIYVRCPSCLGTTLIRRGGARVDCAACGFDYADLARDEPRFEAYLVERMREGPMGQLGAIALHQWVSGLGTPDAASAFRAIAQKHGVDLPAPADPNAFVRRVLLLVAVGVVALVAVLAVVVMSGGSD